MIDSADKMLANFEEYGVKALFGDAGIDVSVAEQDAALVKSLVDLLASQDGFQVKTTENGIRLSQIDHLDDEEINEITDLLDKATGSRMNLSARRSLVQQNNPAMGYPKNGGLAAVNNKYNCMVSGEKRMSPCAGCGHPKGCLSGIMHFKGQNFNG
jgi:hypothetical protein